MSISVRGFLMVVLMVRTGMRRSTPGQLEPCGVVRPPLIHGFCVQHQVTRRAPLAAMDVCMQHPVTTCCEPCGDWLEERPGCSWAVGAGDDDDEDSWRGVGRRGVEANRGGVACPGAQRVRMTRRRGRRRRSTRMRMRMMMMLVMMMMMMMMMMLLLMR
jgi:hypothetical protein